MIIKIVVNKNKVLINLFFNKGNREKKMLITNTAVIHL